MRRAISDEHSKLGWSSRTSINGFSVMLRQVLSVHLSVLIKNSSITLLWAFNSSCTWSHSSTNWRLIQLRGDESDSKLASNGEVVGICLRHCGCASRQCVGDCTIRGAPQMGFKCHREQWYRGRRRLQLRLTPLRGLQVPGRLDRWVSSLPRKTSTLILVHYSPADLL